MTPAFVLGFVALCATAGCKKDATVAAPRPTPDRATDQATDPAGDLAASNALWAHAPAGTMVAIVASQRGAALVERGWIAIVDLLAASPELAELHGLVLNTAREAVGTPAPTRAALGLRGDRGIAVFSTEAGGLVVVLPGADRDKLLGALHGTKGSDGDTVLGARCQPIAGDYVCARPAALLGALGKARLEPARDIASHRGDLEVVVVMPRGPTVSVAAQLEPGGALLTGAITGVPPDLLAKIGTATAVPPSAIHRAGFGLVDVAPYLAAIPAMALLPEVSASAFTSSIAGPVSFAVAPGGGVDLGFRVPLRDPAPARALIDGCPRIAELAALGATTAGGTCTFTLPRLGTRAEAWVDGNELRLGQRNPTAAPIDLPPTALGRALAADPWAIAYYSRGSLFALAGMAGMAAPPLRGGAIAGLRIATLLNEVGVGIRREGDVVRFTAGMRTMWSLPGGVADQLLAIPVDQLFTAATAEKITGIAGAAPSAPFASDLRAGPAGTNSLIMAFGTGAAIAAPVVMDYLKRAP